MSTDTCVSIVPYFKIKPGQLAAFKALTARFVATTQPEPNCYYYGFSFYEDMAHCREAYHNAAGLLAHLKNVGALLEESAQFAEIVQLEIHGIESELAQLREPLKDLPAKFFTLEVGFRN
jgi:quinol monooxygenase YgiN